MGYFDKHEETSSVSDEESGELKRGEGSLHLRKERYLSDRVNQVFSWRNMSMTGVPVLVLLVYITISNGALHGYAEAMSTSKFDVLDKKNPELNERIQALKAGGADLPKGCNNALEPVGVGKGRPGKACSVRKQDLYMKVGESKASRKQLNDLREGNKTTADTAAIAIQGLGESEVKHSRSKETNLRDQAIALVEAFTSNNPKHYRPTGAKYTREDVEENKKHLDGTKVKSGDPVRGYVCNMDPVTAETHKACLDAMQFELDKHGTCRQMLNLQRLAILAAIVMILSGMVHMAVMYRACFVILTMQGVCLMYVMLMSDARPDGAITHLKVVNAQCEAVGWYTARVLAFVQGVILLIPVGIFFAQFITS